MGDGGAYRPQWALSVRSCGLRRTRMRPDVIYPARWAFQGRCFGRLRCIPVRFCHLWAVSGACVRPPAHIGAPAGPGLFRAAAHTFRPRECNIKTSMLHSAQGADCGQGVWIVGACRRGPGVGAEPLATRQRRESGARHVWGSIDHPGTSCVPRTMTRASAR